MTVAPEFDLTHIRLLWLVYSKPDGITAIDLVDEMKRRGWCEPGLCPADLGLGPMDVVRGPHPAVNDG